MAMYDVALVLIALAIFSAIVLPRLFADEPLSFPIVYVGLGFLLFGLPIGVRPPDPEAHPLLAERLTELVVIVALMGAGLKIDRPFDLRAWLPTWRLLGVTMPVTIAMVAFLGWGALGVHLPTAVLLGAVLAPTDPVLASDVGASDPTAAVDPEVDPEEQEDSVRFALTSEAGLNDGLAFPFTYLAIALATVTARVRGARAGLGDAVAAALAEWLVVDLVYRIVAGVAVGYVVGRVVAYVIFGSPSTTRLTEAMEGAEALAATLFAYGLTELAGGYGFIAVFVAALELRHYEWTHDYYEELDNFAVMVERLLMAAVLVLFGGTVAGGLLAPLTWPAVAVGVAVVLVVRPVAGLLGLLGSELSWQERGVVAAFGIRGIGSFYYLSFALHEASFREMELIGGADLLWALTGFVVLTSMVVHGVAATPVMGWIDQVRRINREDFDVDGHDNP